MSLKGFLQKSILVPSCFITLTLSSSNLLAEWGDETYCPYDEAGIYAEIEKSLEGITLEDNGTCQNPGLQATSPENTFQAFQQEAQPPTDNPPGKTPEVTPPKEEDPFKDFQPVNGPSTQPPPVTPMPPATDNPLDDFGPINGPGTPTPPPVTPPEEEKLSDLEVFCNSLGKETKNKCEELNCKVNKYRTKIKEELVNLSDNFWGRCLIRTGTLIGEQIILDKLQKFREDKCEELCNSPKQPLPKDYCLSICMETDCIKVGNLVTLACKRAPKIIKKQFGNVNE